MRTTTLAAAVALLGLAALPAIASAETAHVASSVNLRTGPDADYPRITTLRAGQRVEVYGCINDWSWCDVASGRDRGWVSATYLQYDHGGRRVAINRSGASLGLPVLSFVLGTYWDEHYRNKSWYAQRGQQEQRHPQHAASPQSGRSASPTRNAAQPQRQPQQQQPQQRQQGTQKPQAQQQQQRDAKHDDKDRKDERRPR